MAIMLGNGHSATQHCSSSNPRRTSSVFSRRGTDTPTEIEVPSTFPVPMAPVPYSKPASDRQKQWMKTKAFATKCRGDVKPAASLKLPSKLRGTVLNAVPPAKRITMTALEQEMATSPNEEIISSINGKRKDVPSLPVKPVHFMNRSVSDFRETKPVSSTTAHSRPSRKRSVDTRIGVWRHGVFLWDEMVIDERPNTAQLDLVKNRKEPLLMQPWSVTTANPSERPRLTVRIPSSQSLLSDAALSAILQPIPQGVPPPGEHASVISRLDLATPLYTASDRREMSSVDLQLMSAVYAPVTVTFAESRKSKPSRASSASSATTSTDEQSDYSNHSSATSFEAEARGERDEQKVLVKDEKDRASLFANLSPLSSTKDEDVKNQANLNKPLPLPPKNTLRVFVPTPSPLNRFSVTSRLRRWSTITPQSKEKSEISPSIPKRATTISPDSATTLTPESLLSVPPRSFTRGSLSPTLSQAEDELETKLSSMSQDDLRICDGQEAIAVTLEGRRGSVRSVMQPPSRAPTLPKKSRKREWRAQRSVELVAAPVGPLLQRRRSESDLEQAISSPSSPELLHHVPRRAKSSSQIPKNHGFARLIHLMAPSLLPEVCSEGSSMFVDDGLIVVDGPTVLRNMTYRDYASQASAPTAEHVLLRILASLPSLQDLPRTAVINKGMYRVYRENAMSLVRQVCFNESPACWEYMEWANLQQHDDVDHSYGPSTSPTGFTPTTYLEIRRNELTVIESLKKLILEKCETFIRKETALGLANASDPNASRFTNAFWRIWCFCKIFGGDKGREDDVAGQLDWLKGGLLANSNGCGATMNASVDFDVATVLLTPPEFFAKGNENGLSAGELYDILEIWKCMATLLQGYHGRVEEAREAGIYERCPEIIGDEEKEDRVLEEWNWYLLTLGPSVVLDMAEFTGHYISEGFAYANANGWTQWNPPDFITSRNVFLKEPVSRLYQERITDATQCGSISSQREQREISRRRVASLAAEIKQARRLSGYGRLPLIDMKMERSTSPLLHRSSDSSLLGSTRSVSTAGSTKGSQHRHSFSVPTISSKLAPTRPWVPHQIGTIQEGEAESFNYSALKYFHGVADDTSELAVRAVVDLGFTPGEAREALRMTDLGDGLRVDRAVEYLLRRQ